ncbi:MAG: methyltransferase domain-containing protein [Verrucomicrobiota bacterium]
MSWVEILAQRVSARNRRKKWDLFLKTVRPTPATRVLDVGYTGQEHVETDNFLEKHYPYPSQVTALGIDDAAVFRERYPACTVVQYDGKQFPFDAGAFDVCWCNAVLEHVGGWEEQRRFLQEIHRVSRVALITTPNRFFPVEVHTRVPLLHLLPKRVFDGILVRLGKGWATGNYMHLLSESEIKRLLREAGIQPCRIVRDRFLLFTVDFVVILTHRRSGADGNAGDGKDHGGGDREQG